MSTLARPALIVLVAAVTACGSGDMDSPVVVLVDEASLNIDDGISERFELELPPGFDALSLRVEGRRDENYTLVDLSEPTELPSPPRGDDPPLFCPVEAYSGHDGTVSAVLPSNEADALEPGLWRFRVGGRSGDVAAENHCVDFDGEDHCLACESRLLAPLEQRTCSEGRLALYQECIDDRCAAHRASSCPFLRCEEAWRRLSDSCQDCLQAYNSFGLSALEICAGHLPPSEVVSPADAAVVCQLRHVSFGGELPAHRAISGSVRVSAFAHNFDESSPGRLDVELWFATEAELSADRAARDQDFRRELRLAQEIYAAAGIRLRFRGWRTLEGVGGRAPGYDGDAWWPYFEAAEAASEGRPSRSIQLFFIDEILSQAVGLAGYAVGIPIVRAAGGRSREGVFVALGTLRRLGEPGALGRIISHEIGHALGLFHTPDFPEDDSPTRSADITAFLGSLMSGSSEGTGISASERRTIHRHPAVRH